MHRFLKLHHHRHTGKVLHHRHTSYRALLLVFVLAGFCLLGTSEVAKAEDIVISATVPATIPADPPVLTSPSDGTITTEAEVTFTGTCPVVTPAVIVQLYEGTQLISSGACDANGEFTIISTLSSGRHALRLAIITVTNGIGQQTGIFYVTYAPPVTPTVTQPTGQTNNPTGDDSAVIDTDSPLLIIAEKSYITFGQHKPAVWKGQIVGGTPYYSAAIDWDDGFIKKLENINTDVQTIGHLYTSKGPFTVTITAADVEGLSHTTSYAAVSMTDFVTYGAVSTSYFTPGLPEKTLYNIAVYGSFSAALLTMLLLWRVEHLNSIYVATERFYSLSQARAAARTRHNLAINHKHH